MDFNITTNEYTKDFVQNDMELKDAESFEFHPVPPVKIRSFDIEMKDDYNGMAIITFSDATRIEYKCEETYKTGQGPGADVTLFYNDRVIDVDDFLENYVAGYGGWVKALTQLYVDIKLRKIQI